MFDLHTHTTVSDGTLTPAQLIRLCAERGIRHLSITDHDTVGGIEEALDESGKHSVNLIAGVELSVEVIQDEIHILGYFIDYKNETINKKLKQLRELRSNRMDMIIQKLREMGIDISIETVQKYSTGESAGRPHIARALVELGLATDIQQAFERFLKKGASCFVPRAKLSIQEAVDLILESGGIPVLAHPGLIANFSRHFPEVLEAGIMGIEAYYPLHNSEKVDFFVKLAKQNNLIVTAGSDFHSPGNDNQSAPGCPGIPDSVFKEFIKFCEDKGSMV